MKKKLMKSVLATMAGVSIVGMGTGAFAFTTSFNGEMQQAVIGTTNYDMLTGRGSSGLKYDYFSYGGKGNALSEKKGITTFNDGGKGDVFGVSRGRLGFVGTTDDGLAKFVYTLEVGTSQWGDTTSADPGHNAAFGLSGDGVNVETRFLYADLAIPGLGKDHRIAAGLQPINVNPWLWKETAAGLTYNGKMDINSWSVGWVKGRTDKASIYSDNGDDDYFFAKFDSEVMKGVKLGAFGVYSDQGNRTPYYGTDSYDGQIYYLGLTGSATMGQFFVNGDLIYQGGNIDFNTAARDLDREAWLARLDAGMKPADNMKFWLSGLYVSGDDNAGDTKAKNFDVIDTDVAWGMIFFKEGLMADCDRFFSDAPYILDKGFMGIALYGEYKADEQNTIKAAIRYMKLAEDYQKGYNPVTGKYAHSEDTLGTELDMWYNYAYNKNVDLKFEAAYLFSGKAADYMLSNGTSADDVLHAGAGLVFKF